MNTISRSRLASVYPPLASLIMQMSQGLFFEIEVSQGLRTWAEQDALYAQGRTAPGEIVTDVPGGYSMHCFGLAVDLVPEDIQPGQPDWDLSHPSWQKMIQLGESIGLASGSTWRTFPDNPHFYPSGLPPEPTDQMRAQFTSGQIAEVWENLPTPLFVLPTAQG